MQQVFDLTTKQVRQAAIRLPTMQIPQNIRVLMAVRNIKSAHQLAKLSGVTDLTLSNVLLQKHEVTHSVLLKIAKALDVSLVDLFRTDLVNADIK